MVKNNEQIKRAVKLYAKYGLMSVVARFPQYTRDYWNIENLVNDIENKTMLTDEDIRLISYYVPSGLYAIIDRTNYIDEREIKNVTEIIMSMYNKGVEK